MLGFKTIQSLKPNTEILEVIKDYKYKIKNGKVVIYIIAFSIDFSFVTFSPK